MTTEEIAAIKREALEEYAQDRASKGWDMEARMARDHITVHYPPPPKRVRAEVDAGFGMVATFSSTSIDLSYINDFRCTIAREAAVRIAEMNARADAEGFITEGETATPQPQQKAREWWVNVYDDDPPQWFAHASQSIADKNGSHKEHERIHVREVLPTETPALGTKGNPVTREQVTQAARAFGAWGEKDLVPQSWITDMVHALHAIGLEVEA